MRLYALDMGSLSGWQFFAHEADENGMLVGIETWWKAFVDEMAPTHVVACLDAGHARRSKIDPEYKITRKTKAKPPSFIAQLEQMPALLDRLGVPTLRCDGEEADDCLASVATKYASADTEVILVSTDKDMGAAVNDFCRQYDPKPDANGEHKFWDVAGVTDRLGVPPWRVADFLAIAGDSGDSIKGIKGIGKTYALAALQQTKSIAEMFRKAAKNELKNLKPSTQKTIADGRAEYEHSLRLVELRVDIPVPELAAFELRATRAA